MDFDDILVELGDVGRHQIITYLLICVAVLFGAANNVNYVFTAGIPDYRCLVPVCEHIQNTTYEVPWKDWAIPQISTQQILNSKSHFCDQFGINLTLLETSNETCFRELFTNEIEKCNEWVFDTTERTIVHDWSLACTGNQWKISLVGTSHFAGIIVGIGLFGNLADRYGRKKNFVISMMLMSLAGIVEVLCADYISFIITVFVHAVGTAGVYPLAFVLALEMVGKKKREMASVVLNYFYAIGEAAVALVAWYTKNWVSLQLIVSGPALIFFVYYWIVPESVRWLLAKGKREKAKSIIYKVASVNNVTLSQAIEDSFEKQPSLGEEAPKNKKVLVVIKAMARSKKLVLRMIIVCFIWALSVFNYYGLSINATSLSGNKYVNFALVSVVEIPAYTLSWIGMKKLGRRLSYVCSLLVCGLVCILTTFIPSGMSWAVITLFLVGKMGVTSALGICYIHTAEMLPTMVRSGGVGFGATLALFGALIAPFVPMLGYYVEQLPMLLFGGTAILGGLLGLKLPETLGKKLPETVEEAEKL